MKTRNYRRLFNPLVLFIQLLIVVLLTFSCSIEVNKKSGDKVDSQPQRFQNERELYYTDSFETGDLSNAKDGFKWADTNVPVAITPNGTMGLKYIYGPDKIDEDSWKEQRFHLGAKYSDIWIKYDLYIPANFHHRCPVKLQLNEATDKIKVGDRIEEVKMVGGVYEVTQPDHWGIVKDVTLDSISVDQLPGYFTFLDNDAFKNTRTGEFYTVKKRKGYNNNNKFMVIWQGGYGSNTSGNSISFEYWYNNRGNSHLAYYPAKDQGAWRAGHTISDKPIIDKSKDLGKWMEIIFHIKVSGPANNDGVIELWKNGEKYFDVQNLPNYSQKGFNYYQYGYLLGWANTGFEEQTIMYIDNVVFSTQPILSQVK